MLKFNTPAGMRDRLFTSLEQVFKDFPRMPKALKTSFAAVLLCCLFSNEIISQCTNPSITCKANGTVNVNLGGDGTAQILYTDVVLSFNDNCPGNPTFSVSPNLVDCDDLGTVNVTVTITNAGNFSNSCSSMVNVIDNLSPIVSAIPPTDTLSADANTCARVVNTGVFQCVAFDNCDHTVTYEISGATVIGPVSMPIELDALYDLPTTTFNVGVSFVTWTVDDGSNPPLSSTTTVTITDGQPPILTGGSIPANGSTTTIPADPPSCQAGFMVTDPFVSDNCPGLTYSISFDYPPGTLPDATFNIPLPGGATITDIYPLGSTIVTYKATDAAGLMATHSFTIVVTDQTAPTFGAAPTNSTASTSGCTAAVSLDLTSFITDPNGCTSPANITKNFTITASTNPSPPFPLNVQQNGANASATYGTGTYTILFKATDAAGNMTTLTYTLTVVENTLPIAACQSITRYVNALGTVTVNAQELDNGSTDNCGVTVWEMSFNSGTTWITTRNFSCSDISISPFSAIFRVKDAAGNISATCGPVNITIDDNLAPVAQCKNTYSVNLDAPGGNPTMRTVVGSEINNMSSDNCTPMGSLVFEISEVFGGLFSASIVYDCSDVPFVQTAYLRAIDAEGNISNVCSTQITVNDVTAPDANAAAGPITRNLSNTLNGMGTASVNFNDADLMLISLSTDNCSITTYEVSRTKNGPWGTTATYTCADLTVPNPDKVYVRVTDIDGNTNIDSTTVTILDVDAPTFTCPASDTIYLNSAGQYTLTALNLAYPIPFGSPGQWATDNCSVTSAQLWESPFILNTWQNSITLNCNDLGNNAVRFRATDQSGNLASYCTVNLVVLDTIDPSAACLNISVALNAGGTVDVSGFQVGISSVDNCTGFLLLDRQLALDLNSDGNPDAPFAPNLTFDCADVITSPNEVLMQVTDGSGNTASCTAFITIQDNVDPIITCPADITIQCDDNDTPAATGMATATDNCPTPTVIPLPDVIIPSSGMSACMHKYTIQRTWRATDNYGNTDDCLQTIEVIDTEAPSFTAPRDTVLNCPQSYSVANNLCDVFPYTGSNVTISDVLSNTYTSTITISEEGKIMDVDVIDLQISHTWTGDLTVSLTSPAGTIVTLFSGLCGSNDNIDLNFNDDSLSVATIVCGSNQQAGGGTFSPSGPGSLVDFIGEDLNGVWTLTIVDNANMDGGALTNWALNICYNTPGAFPPTASLDVVDEDDNCDSEVVNGGAREATFKDYEAFKDFVSNTKNTTPISTSYDFSTWSATHPLQTLANSTSVALTSLSGSSTSVDYSYTMMIPANGWIMFDWTKTGDAGDAFVYLLNGMENVPSTSRAVIPVTAGQTFGFRQKSNGNGSVSTTTIMHFIFIDENICPVPAFTCPREFCIARVWDLQDDCDNKAASQVQIIRTEDAEDPVFADGPSTTMNVSTDVDECNASLTIIRPASDGCGSVIVSYTINGGPVEDGDDASGDYAPGTYTIVFTAVDECQRTSTHTVNLTVTDSQFPQAICDDAFISINGGMATLPASSVDNGSFDNCGPVNLSVSPSTFNAPGQYVVTLTVTDNNTPVPNQSTCTAMVTVQGGPAVTFHVGDAADDQGEIVTSGVTVENFNNVTSFVLEFDLLTPGVANYSPAPPNAVININPALSGAGIFVTGMSGGHQTVGWVSNGAPFSLPNGTPIFEVQLLLVGSAGTNTDLEIISHSASVSGSPTSSSTTSGTISVLNSMLNFEVAGDFIESPDCGVDPVNFVDVTITGGTPPSIAGAAGSYSSMVIGNSSPVITPSRNTTWQNGVFPNDAGAVLQAVVNNIGDPSPFTSVYKNIAADVDGNGVVELDDAFKINQIILAVWNPAGITSMNSWRFVPAASPTFPITSLGDTTLSYPNINMNHTNGDFIGIKMGDVTCDANPTIPFAPNDDKNRGANMKFIVADQPVVAGEELTLVFKSKDFNGINSLLFTFGFDAQVVEFLEFIPLEMPSLTTANVGTLFLEDGYITTSWFDVREIDIADGEELFAIRFKGLENANSLGEAIWINSDLLPAAAFKGGDETVGIDILFEGVTSIEDELGNGFALYQNTPNPFANTTTIGFSLPNRSDAKLTIMDAAGRVLKEIKGEFSNGYHQVHIKRDELSAYGVLLYRLETTTHTATKKMILMN